MLGGWARSLRRLLRESRRSRVLLNRQGCRSLLRNDKIPTKTRNLERGDKKETAKQEWLGPIKILTGCRRPRKEDGIAQVQIIQRKGMFAILEEKTARQLEVPSRQQRRAAVWPSNRQPQSHSSAFYAPPSSTCHPYPWDFSMSNFFQQSIIPNLTIPASSMDKNLVKSPRSCNSWHGQPRQGNRIPRRTSVPLATSCPAILSAQNGLAMEVWAPLDCVSRGISGTAGDVWARIRPPHHLLNLSFRSVRSWSGIRQHCP